MNWQEAISKSKKGSATRKQKNGKWDETFLRFRDGSGYKLVAENGVVNYRLSTSELPKEKLDGYTDWQPS